MAALCEEFFFWGSCHHCPVEVGAYTTAQPAFTPYK